jgi:hypothetical protein
MTVPLAMYADRASAPVDIIKPKLGDLAAPQA